MIDSDLYAIDIDAELIVGGGYEAYFVITVPGGNVIVRRQLNRRFDTYSAALMAAYESGRFAIDGLRAESLDIPLAAPPAGASRSLIGLT